MDHDGEPLLAPVSTDFPEGRFDEEDDLYQSIDMEMVKVGGMHAATIDWGLVELSATRYLSEQCKHFRVLGHLGSAWLRKRGWDDWVRTLGLLAGMLERYWISGYPRSGPDGLNGKRKQLSVIGERLSQSLKQLQADGHSEQLRMQALAAIDLLHAAERKHGIVPSLAERLRPALDLACAAAQRAPYEPQRPDGPTPRQHGGDKVGVDFFTTRSDSPLGDERQTRSLYLKLAEYINQHDAYEPTGYMLRRHGLWSPIHVTPPVKRDQRTEMMNVPATISTEYQEALAAGNLSPALLLRIEKSVASSPYWLRGSFLAAAVAQRLEMPTVAVVIQTAVERFVRRLPVLRELQFVDGSPFIDQETYAWLSGASDSPVAAPAPATLALLQSEITALQGEGQGVEAVLHRLQVTQQTHNEPRERHFASSAAADLLAARGLTWLAEDLYAGVAHAMQSLKASEWEPEFFNHVRARSGQRQ